MLKIIKALLQKLKPRSAADSGMEKPHGSNTVVDGSDSDFCGESSKDSDEVEIKATVVAFDEDLLEKSRTRWQFGDWASLVQVSKADLQHHPDRAKLALLTAVAHGQVGNGSELSRFSRLAIDWGCSRRLVAQALISGVHNSIGRAWMAQGAIERARSQFNESLLSGVPGADTRLLLKARLAEQATQLGISGVVLDFEEKYNLGGRTRKSSVSVLSPDFIGSKFDLSIIIPFFNSSQYVGRCLDSVLSKTGKLNVEIICIDDCSSDNTLELLKNYAEQDSSVKVHALDNNKKQGAARNVGIRYSSGEYIFFLDSDDELAECSLESLLHSAHEEDVLVTQHNHVDCQTQQISRTSKRKVSDNYLLSALRSETGWWPCGLFIKRNLLIEKNIFFRESVFFEDIDFVIRIFQAATKLRVMDAVSFNYYERPDSTVNSIDEKKIMDSLAAVKSVYDLPVLNDSEKIDVWHESSERWLSLQISRVIKQNNDPARVLQLLSYFSLSVVKVQLNEKLSEKLIARLSEAIYKTGSNAALLVESVD